MLTSQEARNVNPTCIVVRFNPPYEDWSWEWHVSDCECEKEGNV